MRGQCLVRLTFGRLQALGSNRAGRPTECTPATSSCWYQSLLPMGLAPPARIGPLGQIRFPKSLHPLGRNRTFSELTHFFGIKGRNRNHLCPGLKSVGFMLRGPRLRHSTRPDPPTLATNSPAAVADMDGITRQGLPTVRSGGEARSSRSNTCSLAIGMVGSAPVNQVFRLAPVARRQAGRR